MADFTQRPRHQLEVVAPGLMSSDVHQLFIGHDVTLIAVCRKTIEVPGPNHAGFLDRGKTLGLMFGSLPFTGYFLPAVITMDLDPVLCRTMTRFAGNAGDGFHPVLFIAGGEVAGHTVTGLFHAFDSHVTGNLLGLFLAREHFEGLRVPGLPPDVHFRFVTFAAFFGPHNF